MKDNVIIITGPTASGKSDIALTLAKKYNTEIVSCDSQQLYREMNIGTNKVSEEDLFIHHMVNIVDPSENFSVEDFKNNALTIISQLNIQMKTPIIAGGTGFYIDSILFDMNYGKVEKNQKLRNELEEKANTYGNDFLYSKLEKLDPESAAKYHPNERNRIIRALEICISTGKKASLVRYGERILNNKINPIIFFLNYEDRSLLYDKINKRVVEMVDSGLIDEFKYLVKKYNLNRKSQSMSAIGYKEIFDYVEGSIDKEKLISNIQKNTRRYAKRQITRMKRYLKYPFAHEILMDKLSNIDASYIIESIVKDVYEF